MSSHKKKNKNYSIYGVGFMFVVSMNAAGAGLGINHTKFP